MRTNWAGEGEMSLEVSSEKQVKMLKKNSHRPKLPPFGEADFASSAQGLIEGPDYYHILIRIIPQLYHNHPLTIIIIIDNKHFFIHNHAIITVTLNRFVNNNH